MKQLFISIFILFIFKVQAQDSCEVKLKEIRGKYTGECANGKANGKGKSEGIDSYEGQFKDGYPEGKGMYVWKDGHYFIGFYKKGHKDGQGDMYYESASGEDSVITGFWKKDKYIGEYEKQYVVISTSGRITKVECRFSDSKDADINITLHQLYSNGASRLVPVISNISVLQGSFYSRNNQQLANSSVTRVQYVTFPFRAIFSISNGESAEILFNEKGSYEVYLDM